ncbi:MAG TPA: glycoside hydrolase family 13 protein [Micromonosporaceae bacterium]|nr:glycoside hydrolase family 13 protein [Micromonosporaceae bacterium]
MAPTAPWWRSAVIYQVYVRSFADSDGDGVGDLAGVREHLPYLRDLGVDAIWLTPFYRSPMVDGGYDVADYRDVDPMFGTLADLDALIGDGHAMGLRIIIDLVPNHSSSAHPWFVEALASRPGSAARDRYVFRPGRGAGGELPPNDWGSVFGGPAWTRVADGEWYLHLFDPSQPDLNWANPQVYAEFESILRFWLDRGVDGFRVDVAHGLVKAEGLPDLAGARGDLLHSVATPYFDQEGVHDIYRAWRKILDEYPGDRMAVAEAWVGSPVRVARYVRPGELHQAFNFEYLLAPLEAGAMRKIIDASLEAAAEVGAPTTWVLGNHDTVRPVTRYGDGPAGLARARAAALLTLALPGSMYIYQGEELGLPEVLDLPEEVLQDPTWERSGHTVRGRDGARVPLPWSGDRPPYGFSPDGTATWLPQPVDWAGHTVTAQAGAPASTLDLYRRALRLRREHPALREGTLRWLPSPTPDVLVFARDPGLVCTVNLGAGPVTLPDHGELLCASTQVSGRVLPPDTAAWWSR